MISQTETRMLTEARAAPEAVQRFLAARGGQVDELADRWRAADLRAVVTVARGSSDHAASHFAYSLLTRSGMLVCSMPPSALTLHHAPLDAAGLGALAFSQSGQSPDLIAAMTALKHRGAITAAFVNDVQSPLAHAVAHCIGLSAGEEASVAATKSFIAQIAAGLRLVAAWSQDQALLDALAGLPVTLRHAAAMDWSPAIATLVCADRLFVIARGAALAIAAEMALKLKEVCGVQAEAFSSAEVRHGPMALIGSGYPLLVLAPRGPEQAEVLAFAATMQAEGANVLVAATGSHSEVALPIAQAPHEVLDAVSAVQSFYVMVEALARAKGLDPDLPPRLKKVTLTR